MTKRGNPTPQHKIENFNRLRADGATIVTAAKTAGIKLGTAYHIAARQRHREAAGVSLKKSASKAKVANAALASSRARRFYISLDGVLARKELSEGELVAVVIKRRAEGRKVEVFAKVNYQLKIEILEA